MDQLNIFAFGYPLCEKLDPNFKENRKLHKEIFGDYPQIVLASNKFLKGRGILR